MSARGAGFAIALATLAALALLASWAPTADSADLVAPAFPGRTAAMPTPEPMPWSAPAPGPTAERAVRANAAAAWSLLPRATPGTPDVGVAALLRQQRFAPRIDLAAELWAAFVASPTGDAHARWAAIADRMARLGLECVETQAWRGGGVEMSPQAGEVHIAVVVTAASIGASPIGTRGGSIPVVGVAEVVLDSADPAWGWSASAFPGPHRLGAGMAVPAAELRVVSVRGREPLTLAFSDTMVLTAGTRGTPCFAPLRRVRVLEPGDSPSLVLRCRAGDWPPIDIGLSIDAVRDDVLPIAGTRPTSLVELGRPFGDYGSSRPGVPSSSGGGPGG